MLKNYLKLAFRNLQRNRLFALLNISGLAIGLAAVVLIVSYIRYELSYDKYHENQNIVRITVDGIDDGERIHTATVSARLATHLQNTIAGLDKVVRLYPYSAVISVLPTEKFKENRFVFADSLTVDLFTFEAINGDLSTSLDAPMSVVITESMAIKYYGTTDILGRELIYEDERNKFSFNVTAVIRDIPSNSHLEIDFMASFSSLDKIMPWYNSWYYPPMYTYAQLSGESSLVDIEEKIEDLSASFFPKHFEENERIYYLQYITDIHLKSNLSGEWKATSSIVYVNIFTIIAVFILVIAVINFMNLSTSQAEKRAKEVGLRKVMGAARRQLIFQFLAESMIITFISLVLGLLAAGFVAEGLFFAITDVQLDLSFLLNTGSMLALIAGTAITGTLAGLYPAFYLSSFKPVRTMKIGKIGGGVLNFKRILVTFQFVISGLLIIGSIIVVNQMQYLRDARLGFDKEQIVAIKLLDRNDQTNYHILREQLMTESRVQSVALSNTLPGGDAFHTFPVVPEGADSERDYIYKTLGVDEHFVDTYNLEIIKGRGFSEDVKTDETQAFIINETLARQLNWEDPVGKQFKLTYYTDDAVNLEGFVIGVVKDFHYQSLYNEIDPLVLYINKHPYYSEYLSVRLSPGSMDGAISMMESKWAAFNPDKPFEFYFLDDELDKMYYSEVRTSSLFSGFAVLSIIISCLGLFGLSGYAIQRRMREFGIRKVLGAGGFSIFKLVSKEYLVLVLIANLLGWPLAWFLGNTWLENFAYKIQISPLFFIASLMLIVAITVGTISFHSIKAAMLNPVDTLRDE